MVTRMPGRSYHTKTLQWRHNEHDGLSNRLFARPLFRCESKKATKFRVTGLVKGIHRWPVNSPHKGQVTRKMFPLDDVIVMLCYHKFDQVYWGKSLVENNLCCYNSYFRKTDLIRKYVIQILLAPIVSSFNIELHTQHKFILAWPAQKYFAI